MIELKKLFVFNFRVWMSFLWNKANARMLIIVIPLFPFFCFASRLKICFFCLMKKFISLNFYQKRSLFFLASGVIGQAWPYTSKYLPKTLAWLHFWSICTFFINEIFFKKFEIFFWFFENPKGGPCGFSKNRKKISIIKNVHMDHKWSPAKVLGKYFDVYGQACPITPEARKKKAPFF